LGSLPNETVSSCAALPGVDPLYFAVKPADPACIVEVRLYHLCDEASVSGDVVPLEICDTEGTFITSSTMTIQSAPMDAGAVDARLDAGADGMADGTADGTAGDE
jgi:hypothetical protein